MVSLGDLCHIVDWNCYAVVVGLAPLGSAISNYFKLNEDVIYIRLSSDGQVISVPPYELGIKLIKSKYERIDKPWGDGVWPI